jgi:hypothetical protein
VRSRPGEDSTILPFHIISVRPSQQPRMVGSTLGVYNFGLIFFSARTNKRHHHHHILQCEDVADEAMCQKVHPQSVCADRDRITPENSASTRWYPNGYTVVDYLLFLQEQKKEHHHQALSLSLSFSV